MAAMFGMIGSVKLIRSSAKRGAAMGKRARNKRLHKAASIARLRQPVPPPPQGEAEVALWWLTGGHAPPEYCFLVLLPCRRAVLHLVARASRLAVGGHLRWRPGGSRDVPSVLAAIRGGIPHGR